MLRSPREAQDVPSCTAVLLMHPRSGSKQVFCQLLLTPQCLLVYPAQNAAPPPRPAQVAGCCRQALPAGTGLAGWTLQQDVTLLGRAGVRESHKKTGMQATCRRRRHELLRLRIICKGAAV